MEKRGLAGTIDQMVKDAEAHPGKPYRRPLARGLRVDVLVKDGEMHLQISRDNTWPSQKEWQTVTGLWPSPVPSLAPSRAFFEGRYYLRAKWATISQEQITSIR